MEIPFVTVTKQNFLQKPYGHLRAVHLVVTFQTQPFSTSMPMGERVNILGVYWEFCLFQSLYLIFKIGVFVAFAFAIRSKRARWKVDYS